MSIDELSFDGRGLVPCVVQQHDTGEVLMVAWMNAESLRLTLETGTTWFWSRSRRRAFEQGGRRAATSRGSWIAADCDGDTLLARVDSPGPACHTGSRSCFNTVEGVRALRAVGMRQGDTAMGVRTEHVQPGNIGATLEGLAGTIRGRRDADPQQSYTARLLAGEEDSLLKKVVEEAGEVVMACKDDDHEHIRYEQAGHDLPPARGAGALWGGARRAGGELTRMRSAAGAAPVSKRDVPFGTPGGIAVRRRKVRTGSQSSPIVSQLPSACGMSNVR